MPAFGFVTNSKKELLLIQRGYGNRKGKWSLPGGNRDRGESHRRAAIRETKEETGIRLHHPYLFLKGKRHRYEIWRGKKAGGNIRYQRKECLDAKWFPVNMLPHDDCLAFDPDKKAIGQYANEHSRSRRVHYPRRKLKRAGYLLIINSNTEILLRRKTSGKRKGAFTLPGQNARKGGRRKSAALSAARKIKDLNVTVQGTYHSNRHKAKVFRAITKESLAPHRTQWFPLNALPKDYELAYAIDVRTVDKWARDNGITRP